MHIRIVVGTQKCLLKYGKQFLKTPECGKYTDDPQGGVGAEGVMRKTG